jgi:hypothetical protein
MWKAVVELLRTLVMLLSLGAVLGVPAGFLVFVNAPAGATLDDMARAALILVAAVYLLVRLLGEILITTFGTRVTQPSSEATPPQRAPQVAYVAVVITLVSVPYLVASLVCVPVYWLVGLRWAVGAAAWGLVASAVAFTVSVLVLYATLVHRGEPSTVARLVRAFTVRRLDPLFWSLGIHRPRPA